MNAKTRNAHMLVIGDREVENERVSIRLRSGENLGAQSVDDFVAKAQEAIAEKTVA